MSIFLVTGSPGAGKSYWAVKAIADAVQKGKPVATNIALAPGWALTIAKSNPFTRLVPGRAKRKAARYERLVFISEDLDELFRIRLQGTKEGRGVMILDEAHKWLNSRTWDQDETGAKLSKSEAVAARLKTVRFFSIHRHIGWDVFLIAQTASNLDTQVRDKFEFHVRLRNLRNFKVMGLKLFPMNFFVAIWVWNDPSKSILRRQGYTLNRRIARIYDTHALALDGVDLESVIWLPHTGQVEAQAGQSSAASEGEADGMDGEAGRPPTPAAPPTADPLRPDH
jgi:zona occludens toxin